MSHNHLAVTRGGGGRFQSFAQAARQDEYKRIAHQSYVLNLDPDSILDKIDALGVMNFGPVYDAIPDRIMAEPLWAWGWYACYEALLKDPKTPAADLVAIFEKAVSTMAAEMEAAGAD